MTIDEGTLMAWIDGELDSKAAAEVAAAVAGDPVFAAHVEAQRALAARLNTGFAPILAEPVPDAILTAMVPPVAEIIDFAARRAKRDVAVPIANRRTVQWMALAATLVIGVVIGRGTGQVVPPAIMEKGGALVASGLLAEALDVQLASAPGDGPTRVMLSFKAQDGRYCRSWARAEQTGVACRTGNDWRIAATVAATPEGNYRMAGGDSALMASVDAMIAGEPLDGDQERAAKARGWR